jgi:hypothetical protein
LTALKNKGLTARLLNDLCIDHLSTGDALSTMRHSVLPALAVALAFKTQRCYEACLEIKLCRPNLFRLAANSLCENRKTG